MLQYVKGRKMENNEPIRDQEIEIDLVALFHKLVKHWKALVASMVLLAAVFGLYSILQIATMPSFLRWYPRDLWLPFRLQVVTDSAIS